MNKKILVFLLVAIVALSLSAVSAADNTTDDVSVYHLMMIMQL